MLTTWAIGMIATLMILLMSGRIGPVIVLILTPLVFGLLAGFGGDLGPMMLTGVQRLAPTAIMLAFAILFFSLMVDAGLFDPIVNFVMRTVHGDPVRVTVGTAVLAMMVSLDGNGATTYIICVSAMKGLYRQMRIDPLVLACLLVLSVAIGHFTPWAGPTARVSGLLGIRPTDVYVPLIVPMLVGGAGVIGLAYLFGIRQRRLLSGFPADAIAVPAVEISGPPSHAVVDALKRPRLLLVNFVLTATLLVALVLDVLPLAILFMVASAIALQVNYPAIGMQRERIAAHASNIFKVLAVTLSAGAFMGVLTGTGMSDALGAQATHTLPAAVGPYLAPLTTLLAMPFYFFISNDGFFFGVLPVLINTAEAYGLTPVELARAAVVALPVNLLSPLAASTYVLAGLVGVEFAQLQRFAFKWAVLLALIVLISTLLMGVIPLRAGQAQ
jgi:CitMHS family citrate-Mg2+:H+ or citrate-Ca2+:H+ symporter